jgi:2-deoxystreptamine N-acetyl-D-glucosaminyltransferase/2-deoxystreptamine glucosyltransferase
MALGRPVIAFPVGGVPEIVRAGETGWMTSDRTPAALARAMRAAMSDPHRVIELGQRAREFVARSCSIERMCAAYGEVYRQLTPR